MPLQPGIIYHIYNRGVNGGTIFCEKRNYAYFIDLYTRHILPVVDTYAYCLLPNHFHLLIEVKSCAGIGNNPKSLEPSQAFSNFFNAYAKGFNKAYKRTGPLFERPFKRIAVPDSKYFTRLLIYIHQNPQIHSLIDDFRNWPYSSYRVFTGSRSSFVKRDVVQDWFGDIGELIDAHQPIVTIESIKNIGADD